MKYQNSENLSPDERYQRFITILTGAAERVVREKYPEVLRPKPKHDSEEDAEE